MNNSFWEKLEQLVLNSPIIIDRPKGTTHPRYPDFRYPFDYGYLEDTSAGDNAGIDIWIGSLPDKKVSAIICTVDLLKRDGEIKILLGCSMKDAEQILETHNQFSQAGILIPRAET
jgi:inorganic pyrophosphatase